jgi:serine/threonine protein kinase
LFDLLFFVVQNAEEV